MNANQFSEAARNGKERKGVDGLIQSGQCPESCLVKGILPAQERVMGEACAGSYDCCRFEDLAVGDCFTVKFLPGVHFKTGAESYGIAPGEPTWDAADIIGPVKCIMHNSSNVVGVNFSELPEAA